MTKSDRAIIRDYGTIMNHIERTVASVHGVLTRDAIDQRDKLEAQLIRRGLSHAMGDKEMTFNKWLRQCDVVVSSKLGFGLHDLPDATWRDYFDDGLSPRDATDCAFDDQWGDEVPAELWYGEAD